MSKPDSDTQTLIPFIEAAKSSGASDESIAHLLEERGWTAERVYRTFATYYERVTGVLIPAAPRAAAESARDAFLYLVSFSTLGIWTVALGSVFFILLDRWLPDRVAQTFYQNSKFLLSGNLAAVLVALPIFLLTSRQIARDLEAQPERYESGVRKWLTYIALFIAAGVAIGDLITFLSYFLRGELTGRFVLKVATVLILSGGVLWHYLSTIKPGARTSRVFALGAVALAAIGLALGFWGLGSPTGQRQTASDFRRIADLGGIAQRIDAGWVRDSKLPARLEDLVPPGAPLPDSFSDPVTRRQYEYHPGAGPKYDLCAVFETDTRNDKTARPGEAYHPAGRYCFTLDASYSGADPLKR